MQVEGLPVLLESPFVQRRFVEPLLIRSGWTRAEVDSGPPGNGRRARDIPRRVIHERHQVGRRGLDAPRRTQRSEEHTSELQSRSDIVCRLLLEKKKKEK